MFLIDTRNSSYVAVEQRFGTWRIIKVKDKDRESEIKVGEAFEGGKLEFDSGRVKLRGDKEDEMKLILETSPYQKIEGLVSKTN